jgi:hypothetical protein
MVPGVYLASNRNEYQQIFLEGKVWPMHKADNLTADCLDNPVGLHGLVQG